MEEREKQIMRKYQTWQPFLESSQRIYNREQFQNSVYHNFNGCFGCGSCGVVCQDGDRNT
jgi:NAD-dependent dihydropyrimidine dehydrogenase PreA subunit